MITLTDVQTRIEALRESGDELGIEVCWQIHKGNPTPSQGIFRTDPDGGLRPGLTVAICTYRRPQCLRSLLESLADQDSRPDELLVVDASPDCASEETLKGILSTMWLAHRIVYVRVGDRLRGLTKQRNLALDIAGCNLIAFFDDDVVLEPACLRELEAVLLDKDGVVGVGAFVTNDDKQVGARLRILRSLLAVPDLAPGSYTRSGISVPLRLLQSGGSPVMVDRLPGCAFVCPTRIAKELRFAELFHGYALGEDLEFSRRAARLGMLLIARNARVQHNHDPAGRPNSVRLGRMQLFNRYFVHRTTLSERRWYHVLWFTYAQGLDYVMVCLGMLSRFQVVRCGQFLCGGLLGILDILAWTGKRLSFEARPHTTPKGEFTR